MPEATHINDDELQITSNLTSTPTIIITPSPVIDTVIVNLTLTNTGVRCHTPLGVAIAVADSLLDTTAKHQYYHQHRDAVCYGTFRLLSRGTENRRFAGIDS